MAPVDEGERDGTSPDVDPERDLLQRYEKMIQTQIDTLEGIDEKAAATSRLVGILAGLLMSAASIAAGVDGIRVTFATGAVVTSLAIAVVAFFVSLVYAVITYLSSEFEYGPTAELGGVLATYDVDPREYRTVLLAGYSDAIRANRRVVVTNATRFERSLGAFIVGIIFLLAAGTIIVGPTSTTFEWGVVALFCGGSVRLAMFVIGQEYLTLERVA